MASSVFPLPVTSSAGNLAKSITIPSANTLYSATSDFAAGIYTITCASTTIANIDFFNGTTFISRATTVSGTVTYNLGTDATSIRIYTNTGSDIVINIILSGESVSAVSGTLDTITTTGSYNQTGAVYAVVIGGGGGGAGSVSGYGGGGGGGSGGITEGRIVLSGTTTVTVGAGGNSGGGAGGTSNVGNLTANGGGGGTAGNNNATGGGGGGGGSAGTPGGANGGGGASYSVNTGNVVSGAGSGNASTAATFNYIVSGTTGSGVGGNTIYNENAAPSTAGSGIGTGAGRNTNANGYGSGGRGSAYNYGSTGGQPGVVYILRGF